MRTILMLVVCAALMGAVQGCIKWIDSPSDSASALNRCIADMIRSGSKGSLTCLGAAEQGDATAQYLTGVAFEQDLSIPEVAASYYRRAAEQGYVLAQLRLGDMYANGLGVPQVNTEAVAWYRRAAEQGNARGQASLGFMYMAGRGVPQDDVEAVMWYRRAAEWGDEVAQANLGVMYAQGRGVGQDHVLAHMWYNLAGASGFEKARKWRDEIEKNMSREQLEAAQRLAREWKSSKP